MDARATLAAGVSGGEENRGDTRRGGEEELPTRRRRRFLPRTGVVGASGGVVSSDAVASEMVTGVVVSVADVTTDATVDACVAAVTVAADVDSEVDAVVGAVVVVVVDEAMAVNAVMTKIPPSEDTWVSSPPLGEVGAGVEAEVTDTPPDSSPVEDSTGTLPSSAPKMQEGNAECNRSQKRTARVAIRRDRCAMLSAMKWS